MRIFALVFALVVATPSFAHADNNSLRNLPQEWQELENRCRQDGNLKSSKSCQDRDKIVLDLIHWGYCYSTDFKFSWGFCRESDPAPSPLDFGINAPDFQSNDEEFAYYTSFSGGYHATHDVKNKKIILSGDGVEFTCKHLGHENDTPVFYLVCPNVKVKAAITKQWFLANGISYYRNDEQCYINNTRCPDNGMEEDTPIQ